MQRRYFWCLGAIIPALMVSTVVCQWGAAKAAMPQGTPQVATKAEPLPKDAEGIPIIVRQVADTLFLQGMADPRGGTYRVITVRVGNLWGGKGRDVETRGWVLPDRGVAKQAVCWNGLTYRVLEDRRPANLGADIQKRLEERAELERQHGGSLGMRGMWPGHALPEDVSVSWEHESLLRIALLLRLGETELARTLVNAWRVDALIVPNHQDQHRRDPYMRMAEEWAWALYDRAICALMRGDDVVAAEDAATLTRIQPLINAEAKRRGYNTLTNGGASDKIENHLTFLDNLPQLRQEAERRLAEKPRPPIDIAALKKRSQAERIAELISRLDEINNRQDGQPGGVGLDGHPVSEALIAEGETAVEPLLDTIEKDTRLTRSVSFPRDFFQVRHLLTVRSAAFTCFARIMQLSQFGDGSPSVAHLRDWWMKNEHRTLPERWMGQLADEGIRPTIPPKDAPYEEENRYRQAIAEFENARCNRWEEAAQRIVERSDIRQEGRWVVVPKRQPGKPLPPFKGEPLRHKRNPSVSDLLKTRALELSEPTPIRWGHDYARAAKFALILSEWDPKGPDTLPTLKTVTSNCLAFYHRLSSKSSDQFQLAERIGKLFEARIRLGDTTAKQEYGDFQQ